MTLPRPHYHIPIFWPILWAITYLTIIIFGLISYQNDILTFIKISSILFCLIYVARTFPRDYLLFLAMLLTCIADAILAVNNTATFGLILFLVVQIIHLVRLNGRQLKIPIIIFSVISALAISINITLRVIPSPVLVSTLYMSALFVNVVICWHWCRRDPTNFCANCALAGFLLFNCCDICTGISYLALSTILPSILYGPANFFAWFFYYPSQILVINSSALKYATPPQTKTH